MQLAFLDPHPSISLFGFALSTHGLMFVMGAFVAVLVLRALTMCANLHLERSGELVAVPFVCGLAAARLGYVITYPEGYSTIGQVLSFWEGGLVSYWGILGGIGSAWYLIRKEKDRRIWIDCLVVATLAAWAVGRWGNYWAYESYGVESPVWSVFYGRVPIQIFESFVCTLLALGGARVIMRKNVQPGLVGWWLAMGYFAARFIIDIWRDDNVLYGMHISQWASLVSLLIIGLVGWYVQRRR